MAADRCSQRSHQPRTRRGPPAERYLQQLGTTRQHPVELASARRRKSTQHGATWLSVGARPADPPEPRRPRGPGQRSPARPARPTPGPPRPPDAPAPGRAADLAPAVDQTRDPNVHEHLRQPRLVSPVQAHRHRHRIDTGHRHTHRFAVMRLAHRARRGRGTPANKAPFRVTHPTRSRIPLCRNRFRYGRHVVVDHVALQDYW